MANEEIIRKQGKGVNFGCNLTNFVLETFRKMF